MPNLPPEVSDFLSKAGALGGRSKSEKKSKASARNMAKAREARLKKKLLETKE